MISTTSTSTNPFNNFNGYEVIVQKSDIDYLSNLAKKILIPGHAWNESKSCYEPISLHGKLELIFSDLKRGHIPLYWEFNSPKIKIIDDDDNNNNTYALDSSLTVLSDLDKLEILNKFKNIKEFSNNLINEQKNSTVMTTHLMQQIFLVN
jgi:hypothetical protein